jgi:OOP family OmpA-OmpF porin
MSQRIPSLRHLGRQLAAFSALSVLAACAQTQPMPPQPMVMSNPPPVAPGPGAVWFHVNFDTNSFAVDQAGSAVVADMTRFLQANPGAVATIIGRTDTVGSNDYNMRLSHRRADAVRDALVYSGAVSADRVETRWTGETRPIVATPNGAPAAINRVVDIAMH